MEQLLLPGFDDFAQTVEPIGETCCMTMRQVIGLYVEYLSCRVQSGRLSQQNFANSKRDLERFGKQCEHLLAQRQGQLHDLTDDDLVAWIYRPAYRSDWTRRRVLGLILRCFEWAAHPKRGYIPTSPFERPADLRFSKPRRPHATATEYVSFMRASSRALRRMLFFLWHSAVRPEEARELTIDQIDLQEGVIVLEDHKTVGQQCEPEARIIGLDLPTTRLLRNLIQRLPAGQRKVFSASRGKPWTKNGLDCRVKHLRIKLGIKRKLTPYSFRHGAATEADEAGVNERAIADQLGHISTALIKVYSHAAQQKRHLRRVANEMHVRRRQLRHRTD